MTKTILLIDDDKDIHAYIRVVIEKAGYEFKSAFDGNQGLAEIKKHNPDLIILDFLMPEKNGAEVYQELRSNPAYLFCRDKPVILLTASEQPAIQKKHFLETGFNVFLEKPFGQRELLNVIENACIANEINIKNDRLRKAVEKSKNFLENLVESCPMVILTTDMKGRLTYANTTFKEILGFSSDEVLGKLLVKVLNIRKNIFVELLENHVGMSRISKDELIIHAKDGRKIPMEFRYSGLKDAEDKLLGFLVVAQDLSERKRLEKELLEKERLTAITESFCTVNHKINNPLTPILGNIQLIKEDKTMYHRHAKKLDSIELNAKKISQIIKKFNDISSPIRKIYYGDTNMLELDL